MELSGFEEHRNVIKAKTYTEVLNNILPAKDFAPGKDIAGKLDLTTVPTEIIRQIAKIRAYGIDKYKERDNWKKVDIKYYEQAIYRHWLNYISGEENDNESGLKHLSHIACNVAFILELENE